MENNQENRLTLIKDLGYIKPKPTSNYKKRYGLYKCSCGNEARINTSSIKRGLTKSCGCIHKEVMADICFVHGLKEHRLYETWKSMRKRCNNKNDKAYKNYGGRGISICKRWDSAKNFIDDMYPTFKEGLSIDRINVNGNYEPSNCRWANRNTQNQNTRKIYSHNTSGYRGVSFRKQYNNWQVGITVNKKRIYLGVFKTPLEAAKVYDKYIKDNNLEHTTNF